MLSFLNFCCRELENKWGIIITGPSSQWATLIADLSSGIHIRHELRRWHLFSLKHIIIHIRTGRITPVGRLNVVIVLGLRSGRRVLLRSCTLAEQ